MAELIKATVSASNDGPVLSSPDGPQLLVVDNSPVNLMLLRDMLEPDGYRILEASSVRAALEVLRRVVPDLILSDIHMPEESGYDFLARVRRDPELRKIPFVLTTASVSSGDEDEVFELGADGFIVRPVELARFLAEIARILETTKHRRA